MIPTASRRSAGSALALLMLCTFAAVPFQARAQGWVAGGSIGSAAQQDYDVGAPILMRDDSDTAFRAFLGYLISPLQGLVASYVDLGTPRYRGDAFGGFDDHLDADGVDVSYIIGWAPGNQQRFSVFGTVGVFKWDQRVTLTDSSGVFEYRDEGTSFSLGVGTTINLSADGSNPWAINVEYQLFKDVGDAGNSGAEYDREMISAGVHYRFGRAE